MSRRPPLQQRLSLLLQMPFKQSLDMGAGIQKGVRSLNQLLGRPADLNLPSRPSWCAPSTPASSVHDHQTFSSAPSSPLLAQHYSPPPVPGLDTLEAANSPLKSPSIASTRQTASPSSAGSRQHYAYAPRSQRGGPMTGHQLGLPEDAEVHTCSHL